MKRRDFLGLAGRIGIGAGVAVASLPLDGCKGGNPSGPEPPEDPIPVDLEFKIHNHTQGFKAGFSNNQVMSGTKISFNISNLLGQYAISGVDTRRIALREDNFGNLVEYSKDGQVNLTVPRKNTTYDIFLFNSSPNNLYQWLEELPATGFGFRGGMFGVYRKDFDGQTGEERVWGGEPVPEIGGSPGVFDQMNQVLHPGWAPFRYGNFEIGTTGRFSYGFGYSSGDIFLNNENNTTINTNFVKTIPEQIGIGLGAVFQRAMGWYGGGNSDAPRMIQTNGVLHQGGKDALAFMYVRSPRAHNI